MRTTTYPHKMAVFLKNLTLEQRVELDRLVCATREEIERVETSARKLYIDAGQPDLIMGDAEIQATAVFAAVGDFLHTQTPWQLRTQNAIAFDYAAHLVIDGRVDSMSKLLPLLIE